MGATVFRTCHPQVGRGGAACLSGQNGVQQGWDNLPAWLSTVTLLAWVSMGTLSGDLQL
jgi:hypothetical protein